MSDVVIVSAKRTPIGAFQGALAPLTAPQLGSAAIKAAIEEAGVQAADIQEVIMGNVLSAGIGQAPARQAALGAGVPICTPAVTINKMCGSGLKAVMMAADQIRTGDTEIVLAGGIESMTNAPYLLPKARGGYRMGHGEILDHMFYDGLQSPFDGKAMGCFADATAAKYNFTRAQQDAYAAESVRRAMRALEAGHSHGQAPLRRHRLFGKGGRCSAASSSGISAGAAALVLMSTAASKAPGLKPIARV